MEWRDNLPWIQPEQWQSTVRAAELNPANPSVLLGPLVLICRHPSILLWSHHQLFYWKPSILQTTFYSPSFSLSLSLSLFLCLFYPSVFVHDDTTISTRPPPAIRPFFLLCLRRGEGNDNDVLGLWSNCRQLLHQQLTAGRQGSTSIDEQRRASRTGCFVQPPVRVLLVDGNRTGLGWSTSKSFVKDLLTSWLGLMKVWSSLSGLVLSSLTLTSVNEGQLFFSIGLGLFGPSSPIKMISSKLTLLSD